jgi:hypothetical protein
MGNWVETCILFRLPIVCFDAEQVLIYAQVLQNIKEKWDAS